MLAVECARVLRPLFLAGATSEDPLVFAGQASAAAALCLQLDGGLPDHLFELLGTGAAMGPHWAL